MSDNFREEVYEALLKNNNKFIDKSMTLIIQEQDNFILNELSKATIRIGVEVNKEKLKNWIELCNKLENIDYGLQNSIAVQKKFNELHYKLEQKDQRIKELEAKEQGYDLALNEIKNKGTCGFCEHLDNQQLKEKDHRIKVLERAFHLALASYGIRIGQYDMTAYGNDLLSQAEKEVKDE